MAQNKTDLLSILGKFSFPFFKSSLYLSGGIRLDRGALEQNWHYYLQLSEQTQGPSCEGRKVNILPCGVTMWWSSSTHSLCKGTCRNQVRNTLWIFLQNTPWIFLQMASSWPSFHSLMHYGKIYFKGTFKHNFVLTLSGYQGLTYKECFLFFCSLTSFYVHYLWFPQCQLLLHY